MNKITDSNNVLENNKDLIGVSIMIVIICVIAGIVKVLFDYNWREYFVVIMIIFFILFIISMGLG